MMVTMRSSSSDVISPALSLLEKPSLSLCHGAHLILPLVEVHISLLANEIGVSTANALDLGQGVHDFLLAIDVGIEEAEDELEA